MLIFIGFFGISQKNWFKKMVENQTAKKYLHTNGNNNNHISESVWVIQCGSEIEKSFVAK